MLTTSDFKKGVRILLDGDPYQVLETQTQTPSARGAATLVKAKVRNLRTAQVFDKSFKSGEKFQEPDIERRSLQVLYSEGEAWVFMDLGTYDQFQLSGEEIGEGGRFLKDNLELKALFFEGKVLDLELPLAVDFEVVEVEPGTRGDTVQGSATKGALLSNGMRVQVPLYVETGNVVRISTRDGSFSERVR